MQDIENKLALLRLVYDNIKIINNKLAYVYQNEELKLIDIDGNVIHVWQSDKKPELMGMFLVTMHDSTYSIYSCNIDKYITVNTDEYFRYCRVDAIGDEFIAFADNYRLMIINSNLQFIMDIQDVNKYSVCHMNGESVTLEYKLSNRESHYMRLDRKTGGLIYIDQGMLADGAGVIGVAVDNDNFAVNDKSVPSVRYALSDTSMHAISAGYSDIINIIPRKCYKTYNRINGEIFEGMIGPDGNEILPTIYNNIARFGKDSFILSRGRLRYLFSLEKGFLISNVDKQTFNKHQTLPIIIVYVANAYYICDKDNKIFKFENFTSEYKCYQCSEDNNLLRVDFEQGEFIGTKYVTKQLIPVTNITRVAQAKTFTWTQITGG